MIEERDPIQEYDEKHGTPKGEEMSENDTGPAAAPIHNKPYPIKHMAGGESK
jgi:hypothetical protein